MVDEQSEGPNGSLYFAGALLGGLLLAALLWLMIALGDCWASFDTPAQIRQCDQDKRIEVISFSVVVGVMWLIAIIRHVRKKSFAKRPAVIAGPLAFLVVSMVASLLR
jgi:hypothetical protein